ncbi:MAG: DUF309 domain-containing protein [Bryobacterales bacterium]|nr:DUF309 domain-containing protein [Bryobacteraceae bacterium]MDW8353115.1 DUF309 domain-containing protein [Bryobacterales bacterium]
MARESAAGDELLVQGVELFNQRHFFEAHEVWEELWTPARGPERLFLQALIHLAVAFYHAQRDNRLGALRQLRKGLKKLAGYLPQAYGVDTLALYRKATVCLERVERGDLSLDVPTVAFSERRRSLATDCRSDPPP